MKTQPSICAIFLVAACTVLAAEPADKNGSSLTAKARPLFGNYCMGCHDEDVQKGDLNLEAALDDADYDSVWAFENLITGKMPPSDKKQPTAEEKQAMLAWLAGRQPAKGPRAAYRRISRHEFVASLNDLLRTNIDLTQQIPEDRGTCDFDTDRRIKLSKEQLWSYLQVADQMLDFAYPAAGFHPEQIWTMNSVRPFIPEFQPYYGKQGKGLWFTWSRAKNGRIMPYFFDGFETPVTGWYDVTLDAAKMGDFPEDVSIMVFAGTFFATPALSQEQRLLDVISLSQKDLRPYTIRALLNPGEMISIHCYSIHNYKHREGKLGVYVENLTVTGPVLEQWPPTSYQTVFAGLELDAGERMKATPSRDESAYRRIAVNGAEPELEGVVKRFAKRAFASTISPLELALYQQVALNYFKQHGDFVGAAKAGMKAVVGSPRFLMMSDDWGNRSQRGAALLARSLWLSIPDARLADLAAENHLKGKVPRAEIERMLADPKSKRMIHSLSEQWLKLQHLSKVSPSLKLYPRFNRLLNEYLPKETEAYLGHLISQNLPIRYLIDSDFTFLNQRLAQHYGMEGIYGQHLRKVKLKPDSPRGGLITMGSILTVTADGFHTSPILRGAWVSKNIVGTTLLPPPENIEVTEADHKSAKSLKEQIEAHKTNKSCYTCHKSIDPYGFALECFDATGQWRTRYATELPYMNKTFEYKWDGYFKLGAEVDASGEIGTGKFDDVAGLKKLLLADHKKLGYKLAKTFFEYVNGYQPTLEQRMDLYGMIPDVADECRVRDLLVDVLVYSLETE